MGLKKGTKLPTQPPHHSIPGGNIYALKAWIVENIEEGCKGRNIIFSLIVEQL
jgi:hypothetical protein